VQKLNQLWCKETVDDLTAENQGFNTRQNYIIQKPGNKGSFSIAIDLNHIHGFEDDYDKVVSGSKHSLVLKTASDIDAIIRDGGVAASKVGLTRV
jgi:hypothetical protein